MRKAKTGWAPSVHRKLHEKPAKEMVEKVIRLAAGKLLKLTRMADKAKRSVVAEIEEAIDKHVAS